MYKVIIKLGCVFAVSGFALSAMYAVAQVAPPATCPNFGLERTTIYNLQDVAYAYGYGVAADAAHNTYVTGEQYSPATGLDALVIKYGQNGNVEWTDAYDVLTSGVSGNESGYGIAVASDGSVYVAGRKQDLASLNSDIFVRKYDSAGTLQWTQIYDNGYTDIARAVAVDDSGNVYAAGYRQNAGGDIDMVVLSYDPAGNLRAGFPIVYGGPNNESAYGITVVGSDMYVTGYEQPGANNTDMFVRRYNTVGGFAWAQTYNSGGNQSDIGYGVSIDPTGAVFVTGYQEANGGDSFFRKYNGAGAFLWGDTYNSGGNQNDVGRGVVVGNSGRIFVAGRQQTNNEDAFLSEHYTEKNTPLLPAANPPPGTEDWTTTASVNCAAPAFPGGDFRNGVATPCSTGSHTMTNAPIESCAATSSGDVCHLDWGNVVCDPWSSSVTCSATLVESGFFTSLISPYIYKGDKGSSPEYNEMAFGIAATASSIPAYTATANDVYVVGYDGESGGGVFLNKYSCSGTLSPALGVSTVANFHVMPQTGTAPLTVQADARATAGNIVKYEWDWNYNGTTFVPSSDKNAVVTHTYVSDGSFVVALRVTDTKGVQDIATAPVTVTPNTAPVAAFQTCDLNNANCVTAGSGTPFVGVLPLRVNVNGAASSDPDPSGSIVSFSWDWGDKTVDGSGEKTTHTYSAEGTYTITLTVTDNGGLIHNIAQVVTVTAHYVCSTACSGATPVCGPGVLEGTTQCRACLADNDCGTGYQCLGTSCAQGTQCPDGTMCPFDGKCAETVSCNPLASGATCPDGSACPATGVCSALKYACALSSDAVDTQCYVEEFGGCLVDSDCRGGISGGVCVGSPGVCRYAKCVNTTDFTCTNDNECIDGDGTCNAGVCNYVYDCAYGPGMGSGASGLYTATSPSAMPKMPLGVQPDGQACTKPTPDAPNNCEGINGCLYYNYNSNGTPVANSNNSVGACTNTFQGGTGCVYYQYVSGTTQTEKVNCLPRYGENVTTAPHAGIPNGCFVMDKGKAGKEYDCSAVDGCYYYLDGRVDCRYKNATATTCSTSADCTAQPLAIASCNGATNLCEYTGNGCVYEPNPKGAISCPGATLIATGGNNFVQCLLNKDGGLPGFLIGAGGNALSACSTNADCPADNICINGTCFPACQANVDCTTGEQCTTTCSTSLDCTGSLVCNAGVCTPPIAKCSGAFPSTSPTDATTAIIGLTTNTSQLCNYDPSLFVAYAAMLYKDVVSSLGHSIMVPSQNGVNIYYAQCYDPALDSYSPVCSISYTQGCSSSTLGATCLTTGGTMGTCGTSTTGTTMCIPVCSGATPVTPPNLAAGTTSVTIGLDTDTAQTCKYSASSSTPYVSMTTFATTGGITHSATASSYDGKNAYYAQCYDAAEDAYSSVCSIPFDQDLPCPPGTSLDLASGTCLSTCVPGTMCVYGGLCPTTGICCPGGTTYNAATGNCDTCADTTAGCGTWVDWCVLHPTSKPCISSGCTNPAGCAPTTITGASCNTLGYTFTNTAVTASGNCDLVAIILALLSWMAWIITLLAVLSGLRAAYLYITAMGNEKNLILAKRFLIYTTIGVAVSVLTFSIVAITRAILNI